MTDDFKIPWEGKMGGRPLHMEYPDCGLSQVVKDVCDKYPNDPAYIFFDKVTTRGEFVKKVRIVEYSLLRLGIRKGDVVSITLPNCPQAIIAFYAITGIGAIACMIHPLSTAAEIARMMGKTGSRTVITLDRFYPKFEDARRSIGIDNVIVTSIRDELSFVKKIGYDLTEGRKFPRVTRSDMAILWDGFLDLGKKYKMKYDPQIVCDDPAVILFSGGTTGKVKGALHSSRSFNAMAVQLYREQSEYLPVNDRMLAIMPIFHGFGLGASVHTILANRRVCVLVPEFSQTVFIETLLKHKCNAICVIPTLVDAMTHMDGLRDADLSFLKAVYCGGDSLPVEMRKKANAFLRDHNSPASVLEGYGLAECIGPSCLSVVGKERDESVGFPLPDMLYKIVKPGTSEELPYGETGEICISGVDLMMRYVGNDDNDNTLQVHGDGRTWLHTGDLGVIDSDGYVYFKQRLKRMIVTNGYNVYSSHVEDALNANPMVRLSCVIGVPDNLRGQIVKAFVVLENGFKPDEETKQKLIDSVKKIIVKYSIPREIEFRNELPLTKLNKINFKALEDEEQKKLKSDGPRDKPNN